MTDIIRESQNIKSTFLGVGNIVDPMVPNEIGSTAYSVAPSKNYTLALSAVSFGTIVEFQLPRGLIGDCYLATDLGALTSGNYCKYPGLALVQRIEVISGSNTLQQFDYAPVAHRSLSKISPSQLVQVLANSGGTSFASGTCITPLPLFWNKFGNPSEFLNNNFVVPLNTALTNAPLKVRLTLRSAANVSASGSTTGSPTISMRMYYNSYTVPSQVQKQFMDNRAGYVYRSYDVQTFVPASTIADATNTSYDLKSFIGSVAGVGVLLNTASNVSTAKDYFAMSEEIDFLEFFIDNNSYWRTEQQLSLAFDRMLIGEIPGTSSTVGSPYFIPFECTQEESVYSGALEMDAISSLSVTINQSIGAAGNLSFYALSNAAFSISGDAFIRQR